MIMMHMMKRKKHIELVKCPDHSKISLRNQNFCGHCMRTEECTSCLQETEFKNRCACCGICITCTKAGKAHATYCKTNFVKPPRGSKLDDTLKFALQIQKEEDDCEDFLPRREASHRGYNMYGEQLEAGIHFLHMCRKDLRADAKASSSNKIPLGPFRPREDVLIVSPQDAARLVWQGQEGAETLGREWDDPKLKLVAFPLPDQSQTHWSLAVLHRVSKDTAVLSHYDSSSRMLYVPHVKACHLAHLNVRSVYRVHDFISKHSKHWSKHLDPEVAQFDTRNQQQKDVSSCGFYVLYDLLLNFRFQIEGIKKKVLR